jgi:hypothetical protein
VATRVTRRDALLTALLGTAGLVAARPRRAAGAGAASELASAATAFLAELTAETRGRAVYDFGDAERMRWHWTNTAAVPRNGLALGDMTPRQRALALRLLRASSSAAGYRKSADIIELQSVLRQEVGPAESFDPGRYYVTVFGDPRGSAPWGWRFEGHHLSRHYTVAGDRVAVYPFFLGAWPTRVTSASRGLPRGYRTMPREEDAARELVRSLDGRRRRAAVLQEESLTVHVTQNLARVSPLPATGIAVADLVPAQRRLVRELVRTYLAVLPPDAARRGLARIDAAGFERSRFAWAGSFEPGRPQYYRLQGPTFLLEFDNSRNSGTHIHSVWRDFREDFGRHLA